MTQRSLYLALAAVLAAPALAQDAGRNRMEPTPTLTVSGNAEVRTAPDVATVRLGVTRQAPTAQAAQQGVNEVAQGILRAIIALGIGKEQVQTSELNLFPIYAQQKPGVAEEPRVVAYRASNVVAVRLLDLQKVGPVIDAGLKAGANQLEGVQFGLVNELPSRERALREAVKEAREKARAMSEALDVSLAGVLEVQEGGVTIQHPAYPSARMMAAEMAAATPVSPGQLSVHASVTIRYRIKQ